MSDPAVSIDAVDEMYSDPSPLIESVKLQLAFWEKVVVLDAAILGLSQTASLFFLGRLSGDGAVGYLNAAWRLLFWGTGFALFAQLIALAGLRESSGALRGRRVLDLLLKASSIQGKLTPHQANLTREIVDNVPRQGKQGAHLLRAANAFGSTGLLLSIAAFYYLYEFAHLNALTLSHASTR